MFQNVSEMADNDALFLGTHSHYIILLVGRVGRIGWLGESLMIIAKHQAIPFRCGNKINANPTS